MIAADVVAGLLACSVAGLHGWLPVVVHLWLLPIDIMTGVMRSSTARRTQNAALCCVLGADARCSLGCRVLCYVR